MARVKLPDNCYGLEMADGTKYDKRNGVVEVDDRHAGAIKTSTNGQRGIVSATELHALGTRRGRRCTRCRFHGQAWSITCPRCGGDTEESS